ncbi:endonuclease/exonuclease/phosphatase family protein [Streptomyces sp. NPDC058417]|uniref:endonuclease/exonuclease/phosphatase family protein n=1 Tax=unclassified Streptomyces TaxID=2593676 RepID=UPI0036563B4A
MADDGGEAGGPTRRAGLRTLAAAALAVPLLGALPGSGARQGRVRSAAAVPAVTVMTFNLRFAGDKRPNSWAQRRPVMRDLLRAAAPHVMGTQEGVPPQLADIESDLGPHYDRIGTGRGGGDEESMAVFFDTRRLEPVAHEHFWLSDTPRVRGSNTWGAKYPRMVTWVRFRDLAAGGRPFCVLNTHLDNGSSYARERAAEMIVARLGRFAADLPVLVTGDFNTIAHHSPVYDRLLASGLVDTWDTAARRGPAFATYHAFRGPVPDGDRIDWILASPQVRVERAWVDTYHAGGQYPSDHLPACASLRVS